MGKHYVKTPNARIAAAYGAYKLGSALYRNMRTPTPKRHISAVVAKTVRRGLVSTLRKSTPAGNGGAKALKKAVQAADPSAKSSSNMFFLDRNDASKSFYSKIKGSAPRKWIEYGSGDLITQGSQQGYREVYANTRVDLVNWCNKFLNLTNVTTAPTDKTKFTQNIAFMYSKVTVTISSACECPVEVFFYEMDPKQCWFGENSQTPVSLFNQGLNEQANPTVDSVNQVYGTDWGIDIHAAKKVGEFFKTLKVQKIFLAPGESVKYVSHRYHNKIFDFNKINLTTATYLKNMSHCILVRAQGAKVVCSEDGVSYGMNACKLAIATASEICFKSAQNFPYTNVLNLEGTRLPIIDAVDERFINPSMGIVDDTGNAFA